MSKLISSGVQRPAWSLRPLQSAVIGALAGTLLLNQAWAADEATVNTTNNATEDVKTGDVKKVEKEAEEQESALSSVVVTANKREESAQEVSTAVSVLNGKDLTDTGVGRSASEILNYVPNATATTQQHGRPRWWIRGIGAGQQQLDLSNPVGFYLDEVYISNTTSTGFPLFDLDRVEVLRGPQGTLWGKNTTGGAIAVSSKKPSFNDTKNDDYVKVDYGSYNDKIIEGGVGATLIDERLAGRVSFHQEDQDGRFNNQFTGQKDGSLSDGAIRGQLLGNLTPDLEALLNVHYRKYITDGSITTTGSYLPSGVFRNGYVPSKDYNDVSTNAPNHSNISQNGISLNLKWQLGKLALTSITGYEDFESETLGDGDNTPLELSRSHGAAKSRQYSQEFRLASPREDKWNWLGGIHLFKEDIDSATQGAKLPATQVIGQTPALAGASRTFNSTELSHKDTSFALFGSTTYNWTDKFDTTLGLRWTTEKKEYDVNRKGSTGLGTWSSLGKWWESYTGAFAAAGPITSGTFNAKDNETWNNWTYDFTPAYQITPHDRVYLKYAHGLKSGGFNTAATNLAATNTVKPEQLDSYEVGYKSEWLDGRLNFNATAFHYDYQDVQVNVVGFNALAGQTVSYLQNAKKATVNGAEFEIEALPTANWHVSSSLGLLNTKFNDAEIQNNGGSFAGNELVRAPHVTANIATDYRIPVANGAKVVLGGDARYISKQFYYVTPQGVDANGINRTGLEQDPYTIVNTRVSYVTAGEKYTVTAYVNNLFDKHYLQHSTPAYSSAAPIINGDNVIQGSERTVGVSFTSRF